MLNKYSINSYPFVSLVIPTYNEAANIEKLIRGFISTLYPNLVEILVADGDSTDGTQDIVKKLSLEDSRVKVIHNPLKIQSAGLNLSLQKCTGDIFLRADAHSDYAPDYIERCVEALLESKAINVGGAQRFVAKTPFQAGVALASKSFLGSGGAKYRDPNYDGYADTVYLGCFWTKELRDTSGFDISQITNQDAELNQKLLTKNPQAIYISSDIRVWYYPRETWQSICIQYFKYGRGRYLTSIKHKNQLQLRGKLPFLFISATLLLSLIDFIVPQLSLHTEALILSGLFFPFGESLRTTLKFRKNFATELWRGEEDKLPSCLSLWFFCGVTLLTMPISHFSGYGYQLVRHKIFKVNAW
ncbi:glycosyltransferase family 2 protein [Nostoc parmelioides]|uniref:Glycosyltransferase family 2 protein n=1 Tax=Nostoc parmelioides FACHB-3921 TaxID=2692909 RepID=A0ABR8BD11_9NOSO|nr:glycosyltransferase family 2 protein [Nostoc parmelioides]MBD2251569.1 glycosyltransferase family 2 protein [Nostoc parmelioides FACHB-3921]